MTREGAAEYLAMCADGYDGAFDKAVELACAALRAQAEAEKNEPLTLEDILAMDGQPVWCTENGSVCPAQSWGIVSNLNDIVPGSGFCIIGAKFAFLQDKYGKSWLAYRRKPKEK